MKRITLFLVCLLLTGFSIKAQKVYIRAGLGASVTTAATYYDQATTTSSENKIVTKKSGIGTGLPFVVAAGYMVSPNIGFELGVGYFYGFTRKTTDIYYNSTHDTKKQGQMLSLVPALVVAFDLEKVKPYARLGLKLGVWNNVFYKYEDIGDEPEKSSGNVSNKNEKDYGGLAIGVQAATGVDFKISDLVSLFGEIQVDGINFSPKHGKITKYEVNGTDQLASLSTREKEWDYEKEVDYLHTGSSDEPDKCPKTNHSFNNVGLMIGIKITINK